VRVVEVGRRLGLLVEAADLVGGREGAGQDHLEGDGAFEADLAGAIHHAHPAAGDLATEFIVPKVRHVRAQSKRRRLGGVGIDGGFTEWAGDPFKAILIGEEAAQVVGDVAMTGQQLIAVRPLAGVHGLKVRGDDGG